VPRLQPFPGVLPAVHAVTVLTVTTRGIARIITFRDPGLFASFGLPRELGEAGAE
jgi:hypothetical protein